MGFLLPVAFTLIGLLAILIAFYLFKKKFERKIVSSTYLWEQIMREWETNRWNKKLNQNLLFFLQLLIMIAMIFALARPYLGGKNMVASEQLVIILDSSASMAAVDGGTTKFEQAKEQARKLVQQLNKNQTVTVINEKNAPELLLTNESNKSKAIDMIEGLKLSYESDNITNSIKLADSMVHQDSAEIHVFSDQIAKQDIEGIDIKHNLFVHNLGTTQRNISIRSFGVKQDGSTVKGIFTVFNEGDQKEDLIFKIKSLNKELSTVKKSIPPNKLEVIEVKNLPKETIYEISIDTKDAYLLDNQSYAFLADNEAPVIYAGGEVNPFVLKAVHSLGANIVSVKSSFPKEADKGISIVSKINAEQWPDGPKLVISPKIGGPFDIKDKKELKFVLNGNKDPLLSYVDTENLYLAKAYPIGNLKDLEPIVTSGDEIVVAKGKYKNDPIVFLSFDIEDSDWPLHPAFPVFLNNIFNYLKPQQAYIGRFLPGESTEVSYSPTTTTAYVEDSTETKVVEVNTLKELKVPVLPGIYQLYEKTNTGLLSRDFSVEIADREKSAKSLESFSIKVNEKDTKPKTIINNEIWYWISLIALILLFLEWEVYRRGIRGR